MFITRLMRVARRRWRAWWLIRIACPVAPELRFPLAGYLRSVGKPFGTRCEYDGVDWGTLLGDDCAEQPGTVVRAVGAGRVVYAKLHPPRPDKKRNWGNLVVIAHRDAKPESTTGKHFFSVYGGVAQLLVTTGDLVCVGQALGEVAQPLSAEGGGWEHSGIFFGIYTGPWDGNVLPGYYREDQRLTRPEWWWQPHLFITAYNYRSYV